MDADHATLPPDSNGRSLGGIGTTDERSDREGHTMTDRRRILVLGGRSRIGCAVVERFLRLGWEVETTTRREDDHDRLRAEVAPSSPNDLEIHRLDLSESSSIESFLRGRKDRALDQLPTLTVEMWKSR